jgi:hypothetical protein
LANDDIRRHPRRVRWSAGSHRDRLLGNRRQTYDISRGKSYTERCLDLCGKCGGREGVTAKIKKIIKVSDDVHVQHLPPNLGEPLLGFRLWLLPRCGKAEICTSQPLNSNIS